MISELIKTIKGKTITLRSPSVADYPALGVILNDGVTMAALKPFFKIDHWTNQMIKKRYDGFALRERAGLALALVVVLNETGQVVGNCGFRTIDPESLRAEFGIILHHSVWGTSVALECHLLTMTLGFEQLGLQNVDFETDHKNERMKGFFEKYGISRTPKVSDTWVYFSVSKEDWPAVRAQMIAKLQT